MRSFTEVVEAQGWSDDTRLDLLMMFVANKELDAELAEYAEDIAAIQNRVTRRCFGGDEAEDNAPQAR